MVTTLRQHNTNNMLYDLSDLAGLDTIFLRYVGAKHENILIWARHSMHYAQMIGGGLYVYVFVL